MPDPLGMNLEWHRRLDLGRLARLRTKIAEYDCGAGLFYDPINIRYATGTTNMQVYALHNPCRYAFVPVEGPVVLFEFAGCEHLSTDCAAVDEVRIAKSWYHFVSGPRVQEFAKAWCAEIVDLVQTHSGGTKRLAIDRMVARGAEGDCTDFIFDPNRLPTGIAPTDDPILAIRSPAYGLSFGRRSE